MWRKATVTSIQESSSRRMSLCCRPRSLDFGFVFFFLSSSSFFRSSFSFSSSGKVIDLFVTSHSTFSNEPYTAFSMSNPPISRSNTLFSSADFATSSRCANASLRFSSISDAYRKRICFFSNRFLRLNKGRMNTFRKTPMTAFGMVRHKIAVRLVKYGKPGASKIGNSNC